jgi:xanthine/CO dehydrogenase XdhC/CoxF family maturation factor
MQEIWQKAVEQLDKRRDFAIATIISVRETSPRQTGARLLVLDDGATVGSIGEDSFQTQVHNLALRAIETRSSHRTTLPFCGPGSESVEMICRGEADVLIEFIDHCDPILEKIVRRLNLTTAEKLAAYFISEVSISDGEWSPHAIRHALMDTGNFRIGGFPGCLQLIEALRGREMLRAAQLIELGGWEYPVFLVCMKLQREESEMP